MKINLNIFNQITKFNYNNDERLDFQRLEDETTLIAILNFGYFSTLIISILQGHHFSDYSIEFKILKIFFELVIVLRPLLNCYHGCCYKSDKSMIILACFIGGINIPIYLSYIFNITNYFLILCIVFFIFLIYGIYVLSFYHGLKINETSGSYDE